MNVQLLQGPEGAPNFCFGLYRVAPEAGCELFVQSDWDYAGLASTLGWVPCKECGATDGTVNCSHRQVLEMLSEAYDFLAERDGQVFDVDLE